MSDIYNQKNNQIASTAIVHPSVIMGKNNKVCDGVIIKEGVTVGDNNYIGEYCIIGDVGESWNYFNKPKKGVIIGNNNRFTKQVTIDSGTIQKTEIKDRTIMLKNAHVGHDAIINDKCILTCNSIVGGHSIMSEESQLKLNAVVLPRVIIPIGAIIGANSTVTKTTQLIENGVYVGSPCRLIRVNGGLSFDQHGQLEQ